MIASGTKQAATSPISVAPQRIRLLETPQEFGLGEVESGRERGRAKDNHSGHCGRPARVSHSGRASTPHGSIVATVEPRVQQLRESRETRVKKFQFPLRRNKTDTIRK